MPREANNANTPQNSADHVVLSRMGNRQSGGLLALGPGSGSQHASGVISRLD